MNYRMTLAVASLCAWAVVAAPGTAAAAASAPPAAPPATVSHDATAHGTAKHGVAKHGVAKHDAPPTAPSTDGEIRFQQGRFGEVVVYRPAGRPTSVALFISGDGGWNLGVVDMARKLVDRGAVVVGIDIRRYRAAINRGGAECQYFGGDFEDLSHAVQKRLGLDEYLVPVLVGYSSGATLAYAVIAQSPRGTYAGALSLGFCPDLDLVQPLCRANLLDYRVDRAPPRDGSTEPGRLRGVVFAAARANRTPWTVLHGDIDQVCAPEPVGGFVDATGAGRLVRLPHVGHGFSVEKNWAPQFVEEYERLAAAPAATSAYARQSGSAGSAGERATAAGPGAAGVRDLPVVEVPASAAPAAGFDDTFAVLLTGDGGWAGLDQDVSAALAARGIPVVALNSLKYFWKKREPEDIARDLGRLVAHYSSAWRRPRVLLVGYSFGADVLPFAWTRLPPESRQRVRSLTLLGLSTTADFEFHVTDWLPGAGGTQRTLPELQRVTAPTLCLYGAEETDAACPSLRGANFVSEGLAGGHHFGGDAEGIVRRVLEFTARTAGAT